MFGGLLEKHANQSPQFYSQLPYEIEDKISESSSDGLLRESEAQKPVVKHRRFGVFAYSSCRLLLLIFACVNIVVFVVNLRLQMNKDKLCMNLNAFWSPVWDDVSPAYTYVKFNGTLDAPSEFRGPPSPAVDAAWSQLDDVGSIALDEETFIRAGGSVLNSRMPDEFGGGYMADVEVLHQMHCLNFVRMAAYAEYYSSFAPEWRDSNRTFHIHLDHCIEMIRINLLCQADSGIIPFRWVEDYQRPLPDFSTPHKCRNWNAVLEWSKERQVIVPQGYQWNHQDRPHVFPRPTWMPPAVV